MTTPESARKTILVAAGAPAVRERFAAALELAGHEAWLASTASDTFARLRNAAAPPGLIVIDIQMADAGGTQVIRDVRAQDMGRTPVLVFSGSIDHAAQVRELNELGVAGYVNEFSSGPQILQALAPHLFPDSFNRRGSQRVVAGIPIAYRYANTIAAAVTLNLSRGGVAIRTMHPLDAASRARIRFRLPNAKRDIDAETRVAWSDRHVGMGLEFERLDATDQQAIEAYVERRGDLETTGTGA